MPNKDSQAIAIIDVETTGINPRTDQVIEFAVQKGLEPGANSKTWRIKPSVAISEEAREVHGISEADLANCPSFEAYADRIRQVLETSDIIIGYNFRFDLEMLQAEFKRLSQKPADLSRAIILDPYRLWAACEPRSLSAASLRFAGKELEDAHSSEADVRATGEVLSGMLSHFNLAEESWEKIASISDPSKKLWIGPSQHFQWKKGKAVFGFGKNYGKAITVEQLGEEEKSYLKWMSQQDFPEHVIAISVESQKLSGAELKLWIEKNYGPEIKS